MYTLIVRNDLNPKAIEASYSLATFLTSQAIDHGFVNSSSLYRHDLSTEERQAVEREAQLAIILGGDGTILRTARILSGRSTPMLGINFGNLGFLANDGDEGVIKLTSAALAGELLEDRRANLCIDVVCEGEEPCFQEEANGIFASEQEGVNSSGLYGNRRFFALNELAITRGAFGRVISFSFDISDIPIASLSGDGILVATATGSTAYALAAGGPLVTPGFKGLIVQPLAPHTLTARALLTDANDVVHVDLRVEDDGEQLERSALKGDRALSLFADGDLLLFDKPVHEVFVRRGIADSVLLYADRDHFYKHASEVFFR